MKRLLLLGVALGICACSRPSSQAAAVQGAFGVFFGGEVQELTELEVGSLRPTSLGFRLTFPARSADDRRIHYEVVRPGPQGRRVTSLGDLVVPGAEIRYDQPIAMPVEAELGTWNLRVECDGIAVVDRAIRLRRGR